MCERTCEVIQAENQVIVLRYPFRLISKSNEKVYGKHGKFFLSAKFKDFEKKIKAETWAQFNEPMLKGDLSIEIHSCFVDRRHSDCPNLLKGVCDALQGIVYKNDRQIKKAVSIIKNESSPTNTFQVYIQLYSSPTT